jgi:hypothetical protein
MHVFTRLLILTSEQLRSRLAEFESAAARTTASLITATSAHEAALNRAVVTGDSASIGTAEAITAAQLEVSRNAEMIEAARILLAEAIQREREVAQAAAKAEIESGLTQMVTLARKADASFAAYVGSLKRLRAAEGDLHRTARQYFQSPSMAPQALSACRSASNFLQTWANGIEPNLKSWTEDIANSAAQNIRGAYNVI